MNTSITIANAFYALKKELEAVYDANEAAAIAHELMEHITGLGKMQRLLAKEQLLTTEQQHLFQDAVPRLVTGEPLQYITGTQWFLGHRFSVNKHVLIPRPETEELVEWMVNDWKDNSRVAVLDIGTGSGCIPMSLKLKLPIAAVTSCDISPEALQVARSNADALNAEVNLIELDFLNADNWQQLPVYDVIVSNPPYIPISEKESLDKNVRDYEPGTALFVPEDDALLFYRKIAIFGKDHLQADGAIYCELHRDYAVATKLMFEEMGYSVVELRQDMHGNERMLKAGF